MRRTHVVLVGLLLSACGQGSTVVAAPPAGPSESTAGVPVTEPPIPETSTCLRARAGLGPGAFFDDEVGHFDGTGPRGINGFGRVHAAVVATVVDVASVRWNSVDGGGFVAPFARTFRPVTVKVERVVWSTSSLVASPDAMLSVAWTGDGTDCGQGTYSPLGVRWNQSDGPVAVGDRRLLLLSTDSVRFSDGSDRPQVHVATYGGNWLLRADGMAENLDPERTVPADALEKRLLAEHVRGPILDDAAKQRDDERTSRNPLATG